MWYSTSDCICRHVTLTGLQPATQLWIITGEFPLRPVCRKVFCDCRFRGEMFRVFLFDTWTERFSGDSYVLEGLQKLSVMYFQRPNLQGIFFISLTWTLTGRSVCFIRTSAIAKHLWVLAYGAAWRRFVSVAHTSSSFQAVYTAPRILQDCLACI
jgi:hypothetical protein